MATITYSSDQSGLVFRVFNEAETTTWNGSAMQAHASVSDYGADGVLTPVEAAGPGGGNDRRYTITLPALANSTAYKLVPFAVTPVIGGYWPVWKDFTLDASGAVITEAGLAGEIATLEAGVSIVPISATLTQFETPKVTLQLHAGESKTFQITLTDQDSQPIDLAGDTIQLVVSTLIYNATSFEQPCTVIGDDDNVVNIPIDGSDIEDEATLKYELWNVTSGSVLVYGAFEIRESVVPA